tara:strand:- start:221 stop:1039 length:819 start_codon:yes stop_codon:yes gene_type:complete
MKINRKKLKKLIIESLKEKEENKKKKVFSKQEKNNLIKWAIKNDPVKTNNSMSAFNPDFLPKVENILSYLSKKGPSPALKQLDKKNILPDNFQPEVSTAFRSLKDQQAKLSSGRSQVAGLGYHVCYTETGEPNSHSADIVDENYQWGAGKNALQKMAMWEFFMHLGIACEKYGIPDECWGGNWSYPKSRPGGTCEVSYKGIKYILTRFGFSKKTKFMKTQALRIGWDPAHIQAFDDEENTQRIKNTSYVGLNYLKNKKTGEISKALKGKPKK